MNAQNNKSQTNNNNNKKIRQSVYDDEKQTYVYFGKDSIQAILKSSTKKQLCNQIEYGFYLHFMSEELSELKKVCQAGKKGGVNLKHFKTFTPDDWEDRLMDGEITIDIDDYALEYCMKAKDVIKCLSLLSKKDLLNLMTNRWYYWDETGIESDEIHYLKRGEKYTTMLEEEVINYLDKDGWYNDDIKRNHILTEELVTFEKYYRDTRPNYDYEEEEEEEEDEEVPEVVAPVVPEVVTPEDEDDELEVIVYKSIPKAPEFDLHKIYYLRTRLLSQIRQNDIVLKPAITNELKKIVTEDNRKLYKRFKKYRNKLFKLGLKINIWYEIQGLTWNLINKSSKEEKSHLFGGEFLYVDLIKEQNNKALEIVNLLKKNYHKMKAKVPTDNRIKVYTNEGEKESFLSIWLEQIVCDSDDE